MSDDLAGPRPHRGRHRQALEERRRHLGADGEGVVGIPGHEHGRGKRRWDAGRMAAAQARGRAQAERRPSAPIEDVEVGGHQPRLRTSARAHARHRRVARRLEPGQHRLQRVSERQTIRSRHAEGRLGHDLGGTRPQLRSARRRDSHQQGGRRTDHRRRASASESPAPTAVSTAGRRPSSPRSTSSGSSTWHPRRRGATSSSTA